MKLSKKQKIIIYGLVLGDGFLQKTGKKNARLRIEYSAKQKEDTYWIYHSLENLFVDQPQKISRQHPKSKQIYHYYRLQSQSAPIFGKLHSKFYQNGKKIVPLYIDELLMYKLTLAVWYMDDGYYDKRDKSAHIYLQKLTLDSQRRLLECLQKNFGLTAKIYCRPDRQACQINFTGKAKDRLVELIRSYVIPEFNYKLPSNPVSTESENK